MADHSPIEPRLPRRPLLWPDAVLDLADLLHSHPQPIYIVGGAVRDAYLHHPIKDLDLITTTDAAGLGRKVANALNGDFYVMDAERDVARVLLVTSNGRLVIDIARFRGPSLLADLSDRDFTINAMAVDLGGDLSGLIDPLGGEDDLTARRLRACSDHALTDDPFRALRAVRQSTQLDCKIDPELLPSLRAAAPHLAQISVERVRDEFFRILSLRTPQRALRVAEALGLMRVVVPEIALLAATPATSPGIADGWAQTLMAVEKLRSLLDTISPTRSDQTAARFGLGMVVMALDRFRGALQAHIAHQWPDERPHEALLMLAALLYHVPVPEGGTHSFQWVIERAGDLRLSKDEQRHLRNMLAALPLAPDVDVSSKLALHRFWRAYGLAGVDASLLSLAVYLAEQGAALNQDAWLLRLEQVQSLLAAYYEEHDSVVAPAPLVDGVGLMDALDVKPGRIVGELLDVIREAQVEGHVTNTEGAITLARRYLDEHPSA